MVSWKAVEYGLAQSIDIFKERAVLNLFRLLRSIIFPQVQGWRMKMEEQKDQKQKDEEEINKLITGPNN